MTMATDIAAMTATKTKKKGIIAAIITITKKNKEPHQNHGKN